MTARSSSGAAAPRRASGERREALEPVGVGGHELGDAVVRLDLQAGGRSWSPGEVSEITWTSSPASSIAVMRRAPTSLSRSPISPAGTLARDSSRPDGPSRPHAAIPGQPGRFEPTRANDGWEGPPAGHGTPDCPRGAQSAGGEASG